MNLSSVIKQQVNKASNNVMKAGPKNRRAEDVPGFEALDTLWSDKGDNISSMITEKERQAQLDAKEAAVIAQAEAKAAEIERAAYAKGFEEGKQAGVASLNAEKAKVIALLEDIQKERSSLYSQYEEDAVELLKAVVDKIVNHEVSVNPRVISACLQKSLSYVIENSRVKVRLSASDFNRVKDASLDDPKLLEGLNQLELIEDNAISEGGCFLETEFGEVDATLEHRKNRMFKAIDEYFLHSLAG